MKSLVFTILMLLVSTATVADILPAVEAVEATRINIRLTSQIKKVSFRTCDTCEWRVMEVADDAKILVNGEPVEMGKIHIMNRQVGIVHFIPNKGIAVKIEIYRE